MKDTTLLYADLPRISLAATLYRDTPEREILFLEMKEMMSMTYLKILDRRLLEPNGLMLTPTWLDEQGIPIWKIRTRNC